jgi:hypothetical protein
MGWALGAIMYEINEYPWEQLTKPPLNHSWLEILLAGVVGKILVGRCFFVCVCIYIFV